MIVLGRYQKIKVAPQNSRNRFFNGIEKFVPWSDYKILSHMP